MPNFLTKLLEPTANGPEAAQLLVKLLNVKITVTTLKKGIEEHPDYPSLLSISDVLNDYRIENMGIKFNSDTFNKIPCPFITQLKGTKSTVDFFTVVKSIDNFNVTFFDVEKQQWGIVAKNDFLKRCSDVALITEVGDNVGEKDYAEKRKEEKQKQVIQYIALGCFPAIIIIADILALLQSGADALLPFIFSVLTLLGSVVGVLLLWYELDQHNPVLQQICSGGNKINCGAVLQSKASKLFGISWSAIGFSYFTGNLLLLLFWGGTNHAALFITAWVNAIASPYVLFSVYYQWQVAKQWCILCLCTQALLVLQLVIALIGGWHTLLFANMITATMIIQALTAFAVPLIATFILLPALQKAKESKKTFTELQKLKHTRQVFDALLSKQQVVTESTRGLGLTLGNPDATIKIIKVCNTFCGPCAKAHSPMHALLENNPNVQIQIIFTGTNAEGDERTIVANHLLSIAEEGDEKWLSQALDDWYVHSDFDYDAFARKYPMGKKIKKHNTQIELMSDWCDKMNIRATPTFFINGYKLPDIYTVADFKYFLSV
jgi:uncharacterized membrane protein/protein-disulfide isomerase